MDSTSLRRILFAFGIVLSLVMVARAQFTWDQYELMRLGWQFYEDGALAAHGARSGGGGMYPGVLTGLLFGGPLFIVEDHRAAALLILVSHILAYVLIDSVLKDVTGSRGRLIFCLLYWLNPWRVYYSTFLWNPNWLFFIGAVHLWSTYRLRRKPRVFESFVHVTALGFAYQMHGSFLILVAISVLLFARRDLRLHWGGAAAAATVQAAFLAPYFVTAIHSPEILPLNGEGFIGRGLLTVYPVLRGVGYWFRFASLSTGHHLAPLDFTPALGAAADTVLAPAARALIGVAHLSVAPALFANVWLWRRSSWGSGRPGSGESEGREWLLLFCRWSFVGAFVAFCLSPITIMGWSVVIILHVAVLPMVFWFETLEGRLRPITLNWALRGWIAVTVLVLCVQAVAAPMYRYGGREKIQVAIRHRHPMLERLEVSRHCTIVVDPINGLPLGSDRSRPRSLARSD